MRMVRPQFLQAVEQRVREAGSLLIADEVMAGFGRCGRLLASQRAGITPDLVALSKGLTAGFLPMGITLATKAIFEEFLGTDPTKTLWHGHSFTANPLGCAAANASLDLLEAERNFTNNSNSAIAIDWNGWHTIPGCSVLGSAAPSPPSTL